VTIFLRADVIRRNVALVLVLVLVVVPSLLPMLLGLAPSASASTSRPIAAVDTAGALALATGVTAGHVAVPTDVDAVPDFHHDEARLRRHCRRGCGFL
jgi:hypothetical protein